MDTLTLLFRHKTWATLKLIEACRGLTAEQLAASAPGTYGTIHETLQHLVGSDESYCDRVSGSRRHPRIEDGAALLPLDELAARTAAVAEDWLRVAADPDIHATELVTSDGWRTTRVILIAQAIHHSDDHRGHVLTVVGAQGFELPGVDIGEDLDVWHLGIDNGMMRPVG